MTLAKVRVGIVGLGAIGARVMNALTPNPDTPITAVCDVNAELAQRVAKELGGAAWSTDYRAMLTGDQVDLVYVAVPPRFHHRIALDVFAAGKHIFCEKPLALNLAEAREMAQAAEAAGVVHAINLSLPRSPGVQAWAQRLRQGYVGQARRIDINFLFPQWPRAWQINPWIGGREQGGPIRECGPHLFHLVLREFGPVKRVWAHMEYPADPALCEQGATGLLELESGIMVSVGALCNLPRPEQVSLTVYGTEGTLGLREWGNPVGAQGNGELKPIEVDNQGAVRISDELVKAVRGEQADLVGFAMGLQIQGVLDAWERSAESGHWEPVNA